MATPEQKKKPTTIQELPGYNGKYNQWISRRVEFLAKELNMPALRMRFPHLSDTTGKWRHQCDPLVLNPAPFIDHTILKPEATAAQVSQLCSEAKEHKFFAVCVNGGRAAQCLRELYEHPTRVAAVIGFPLGAATTKAKVAEARELVDMGCAEIDMVMNVGSMKDRNYRHVFEDIAEVVRASHPGIVKVILETCLLTDEEIIDACILSIGAGANFVKTSTGFNTGGATKEALDIMLAVVGNEARVKASGGVRDAAMARAYIAAGVKRIGTSSGITMINSKL